MTKRKNLTVGTCVDCGAAIQGGRGRKLCVKCRKKREAARSRARNAARREVWQQIVQRCEVCGAEFTAKGKCRYCPSCRNYKRGEARRRETKWVSWVSERVKRGKDNRPDPALADPPKGPVLAPEGAGSRERAGHHPPAPPPKGTKPGSMEDVAYRLNKENYERWLRGESPISYGYFVAYLEGRIPLKK